MDKYVVQKINANTYEVLDECFDDQVFDNETDAEIFREEVASAFSAGAECLRLRNPFDYNDNPSYEDPENIMFVVEEI